MGVAVPGEVYGSLTFDLALDHIELVDMAQRDIGFGRFGLLAFALRLGPFGGFNELAAGMIPAANAGDVVGPTHLPVAGVAIDLQDTGKVIQQTHGYTARA